MGKISFIKVWVNVNDYINKLWVILNWASACFLKHQEEIQLAIEIQDFVLWLYN
jgi:uncharacterized membrane protein YpjA